MKPNVFIIKHRNYGYTIDYDRLRPRNAPKYQYTKADSNRKKAMAKLNLDTADAIYQSLEEVIEAIKKLEGKGEK